MVVEPDNPKSALESKTAGSSSNERKKAFGYIYNYISKIRPFLRFGKIFPFSLSCMSCPYVINFRVSI